MFTLDPWVGCKRERPWDRQETKTETKEWRKQLGQRWLGCGKWAQLGLMFFSLFLFGEWLPWASCVPSILQSLLPQNPETEGWRFRRITQIPQKLLWGCFSEPDVESPKPMSCDTGAAVYERDLWSLLVSRWWCCFSKTAVMGQTSLCSVTELLQHVPLHIFYNVTLRSETEPLNVDSASAQTQMWMVGGPVIPIWRVLLCHCCRTSHFQKSNACAI